MNLFILTIHRNIFVIEYCHFFLYEKKKKKIAIFLPLFSPTANIANEFFPYVTDITKSYETLGQTKERS